ncbi:hypothetical protein VTN02DRAFT_4588 [Thermoascus thermophilus]
MMSISPGIYDHDSLLHICWRRQSCGSCLADNDDDDDGHGVECGWCPFSSACVPILHPSSNQSSFPHHLRLPGILTPIHNAHICPLGAPERWDLRTAPFGCAVSTMTLLTTVISVLGTLAAIGMVCVGVRLARSGRAVEPIFGIDGARRFVDGGGYRWRS